MPKDDEPYFGTIEEENELEFEYAIADSLDPEIISIPHKSTG